ncbi:hypothetical protein HY772_06320 [Candidatus Woesearchaeota archaeon]|nr:hypothetical protein [Candidatus Woesearchaeota archaeon]
MSTLDFWDWYSVIVICPFFEESISPLELLDGEAEGNADMRRAASVRLGCDGNTILIQQRDTTIIIVAVILQLRISHLCRGCTNVIPLHLHRTKGVLRS